MRTNVDIDVDLACRLAILQEQPERNPEKAVLARSAYLDLAQEMANSSSPAVTATRERRHIGWMHPLQQLLRFRMKEHSPMFSAIGTFLLIFSLVLGGGGATVAAAQNSLPDNPLYPVKTWSEDVRTGLTTNNQARFELALSYANRRAEEIQLMLRAGEVPPEAVQIRMQTEIDLAMRLAAGQSDVEVVQLLEKIRQQIQTHEQAFASLGSGSDPQVAAILDRMRSMLQEQLRLCDQGIENPDWLRQQLQNRDRLQDGNGPLANPTSSGAGNPWTMGTPTPGSGYGPGPGDGNGGANPWTTGTPTPGSGYGPGPGDGGGGDNPWMVGTPTPGSGYGPGPKDGTDEPGGNENPGGNGTGSTGGGESGTGDDQGSGSTDGGSTGSGNSNTGGAGTGEPGRKP